MSNPAQTFVHPRANGSDSGGVTAVVWSPDGHYILSANIFEGIILWDVKTGQQVHKRERLGRVAALAWSPDGAYVAIGSGTAKGDTGTVRLLPASSLGIAAKGKHKQTRGRPRKRPEVEQMVAKRPRGRPPKYVFSQVVATVRKAGTFTS